MLGSIIVRQSTRQTPISKRFGKWMQNHKTRQSLKRLCAARLMDLGLTTEQVRAESRKWFWQD
jgi:uncharacterized protein YjiS (DUF1127 family)